MQSSWHDAGQSRSLTRFLRRHRKAVWAIVLVAVGLAVLSLQATGEGPLWLQRGVAVVTTPVQRALATTLGAVQGVWSRYANMLRLEAENQRLRQELARYRSEAQRHQEALQENKRLRALLDFTPQSPFPTVAARVVGRDPSNWYGTLFLDKGSEAGIEKDMPVLAPDGLVGRILAAFPGSAKVLLITDPRSALAVRVQRTREEGILEGLGGERCRVNYITASATAREGDLLNTSGLDGFFPAGLSVGTISRMEQSETGLFQRVGVDPSASLHQLEEVAVMIRKPMNVPAARRARP